MTTFLRMILHNLVQRLGLAVIANRDLDPVLFLHTVSEPLYGRWEPELVEDRWTLSSKD